ncbi:DNA-binding CsgD family transcriptional regulator [Novosphingobium hassiacum]|uniref:DNA-binding CsgD family transcriptional regulator n=1 Tax=Novosphingobium hassiacum TaxID=173676 RepID=A0A7W5ZVF6_9SPHN|nr:hypothetical protein [Novosphingobium hassiacum]MBB3860691.1 DNA-binding CsgD family transcriptional regulator [Novosphingobium hassiacum]
MPPLREADIADPDWDELFLSAAVNPALWLHALDAMANATGSSHGQLIGIGADRTMPFNLVTGFSEHDILRSLDAGGASPETNYRIAANDVNIGRGAYDPVLHEEHYDAVIPQLTSRNYVDFCAELDIPNGCQTNLVIDNRGLIGLAILRSRKDGRTRPAQRRRFGHAAESARRAVRLQERLENDQARLLAGTFEAMETTAFILDGRGHVRALTLKAEELVRSGKVRLVAGELHAAGSPFSLKYCCEMLTDLHGHPHVRTSIGAENDEAPLFFEGFRLPRQPWQFGLPPQAILITRAPSRDRAGITGFLQMLYGFSSAEADIAMRLFNGQGRASIASEREVTPDTLRGQIKSLLSKADCSNEAALMRLLASIVN